MKFPVRDTKKVWRRFAFVLVCLTSVEANIMAWETVVSPPKLEPKPPPGAIGPTRTFPGVVAWGGFHEGLMVGVAITSPADVKPHFKGYFYVDQTGHNVFGKSFWLCYPFHDGVALIGEDGNLRCIDRNGRYLSEPVFNGVNDDGVSEGVIPVTWRHNYFNNLAAPWGFATPTGEEIIKPQYQNAGPFHEGLAPVCLNDKCGYINKSGRVQIEFKFDAARAFSSGIASVKQGEKWGCINWNGQWVVKPEFDKLRDCHNGAIAAQKGDKWGMIDATAKVVIPMDYDAIGDLSEERVCAKKGVRWGFLDRNGKTVVPFDFFKADNFHEGVAAVMGQNKLDYQLARTAIFISHDGSRLAEREQCLSVQSFSDGLATMVGINETVYILDRNGVVRQELPKGHPIELSNDTRAQDQQPTTTNPK
jgi:hypothetical protein